MLYVLAYPALAQDAAERIETFRQTHEPERAGLVRAHITLVFGTRSIELEDLSSRVAVLAAETAPFAITLDRAEQVESPGSLHNIFLLAGIGKEKLASLHRKLYAGRLSAELLPGMPFRAHMTIATSAAKEPLHSAMRDVTMIGLPVPGMIDALQIVALRDGRLEDVSRFRLSGG
jgi:2'-5' RNA ligase